MPAVLFTILRGLRRVCAHGAAQLSRLYEAEWWGELVFLNTRTTAHKTRAGLKCVPRFCAWHVACVTRGRAQFSTLFRRPATSDASDYRSLVPLAQFHCFCTFRRNRPATMCPVVVVVLRIIVVVKMIPAIAVIDVAVPIVVDAVRFVMDTARLFCRRGSNVGRTAEGTSAEGKSVEKPNQTVVGGRARYMAGHTQPLARVLMNKYAIIPKQLS